MFNWLRRRRLSAGARKKLLVVHARAEEALVETHVANIFDLLDALGDEVDVDRGVEMYIEMMALPEMVAATVTTRVLASLEAAETAHEEPSRFRHIFRDGH